MKQIQLLNLLNKMKIAVAQAETSGDKTLEYGI